MRGTGLSLPWTTLLGRLLLALLLFGPIGCGSSPSGTEDEEEDGGNPGERVLTVLYTAEERGQLVEGPASEGPAKLMGLWRSAEGLEVGGDFLVLSGGNSWIGQLLSTWFDGASMVEVMKTMGYAGTAIGAHEFHFGVDALRAREAEAGFPYLSANLRLKSSGSSPDFAAPFTVLNVNGIHVGLVGLTSTSAPTLNVPANVQDFDFLPYAEALNQSVPQAKAAGADVVIVLANLCRDEVAGLETVAGQLGVSMIGGGFCGQTMSEVSNGVALVIPQWRFAEYGKVTIRLRSKSLELLGVEAQVRSNSGGSPDPEVETKVETWQNQADTYLSEVIGYVTAAIPDESPTLFNLVMDSWLFAYPTADIAMLNAGAIRQGLPAGDITRGAILGMMPFENSLVELELTGAEVVDCLEDAFILGGMTTVGGYFHADGTPLKTDSVYHVLTTDFLYGQTNFNFAHYDTSPFATGELYSQPTLTYLESLGTTEGDPLDALLDPTPRR